MLEFPVDIQYEYRGKKTKWFSFDNEEWFENHKPLGWDKDSIEYRFNDHAFRMDVEMKDVPHGSDIYIGDSTTMGFGVNLEDTWAFKHHKMNNNSDTFVNLGVAAGCLDTIYRLLNYWLPKIKPSNIFILDPAPFRQEFIMHNGIARVSAIWDTLEIRNAVGHTITDEMIFNDKLFKDYVSVESQCDNNRSKNLHAISKICEGYNTVFAEHPPHGDEYFGGARDKIHSGPEQQDKILDWFVGIEKSAPLPSFR